MTGRGLRYAAVQGLARSLSTEYCVDALCKETGIQTQTGSPADLFTIDPAAATLPRLLTSPATYYLTSIMAATA